MTQTPPDTPDHPPTPTHLQNPRCDRSPPAPAPSHPTPPATSPPPHPAHTSAPNKGTAAPAPGTACLNPNSTNFYTAELPCPGCISVSGQGVCNTTNTSFDGMLNDRYSFSFTISNNAVTTNGTIYWNNTYLGGSWILETEQYGICSYLNINSVLPIVTPSQWINSPGAAACLCFSDSAAFGPFGGTC